MSRKNFELKKKILALQSEDEKGKVSLDNLEKYFDIV
jgi:hypothetical protein